MERTVSKNCNVVAKLLLWQDDIDKSNSATREHCTQAKKKQDKKAALYDSFQGEISIPGYERSPLLILKQDLTTPGSPSHPIPAFQNPNQSQNRKRQRTPMDEPAAPLMVENRPKAPGDSDAGGEVAFGGWECVAGGGRFEEE